MRKQYYQIYLTLILMFTGLILQAQNLKVSGIIYDSLSRQPLSHATVTLNGISDTGFSLTVLSNNKGLYQFTVPAGSYRAMVEYLGYKNWQAENINIKGESYQISPVWLVLDQKNLKTVTVTAHKPYITISAAKITLNVAQSPVAAGNTVYEVIKRAPGIIELGDQFSFRGKSITVYINDRPTHLTGEELKNMLMSLPANSVEKIEILPNPTSKYDAQGGAIINVVLARNKSYGNNYVLTSSAGTGRFFRTGTGLDVNHRGKNILVNGGYNFGYGKQYYKQESTRYLTGADILSKEYDVRSRLNHFYKLGVDYDLTKRSTIGFFLNGIITQRNREVENSSALHYPSNTGDTVSRVYTSGKANVRQNLLNLYYKTILDSSGKELNLNADLMKYSKSWRDDFVNRYYDPSGSEFQPAGYIRDQSPGTVNVYSFSADFVWPTRKGRWESGVKTTYTVTDNDIVWENNDGAGWYTDNGKTNHFIYKETVNAAYLNYIWNYKKWNLQSGIRTEQTRTSGYSVTLDKTNKKEYINWFPNFNLQYTLNQENQFGLTYRKSIQRFGFSYVNPFIIYQSRYSWSQGNPAIEPEIYHSLELNYTYKQSWSASLNYAHGIKTLGEVYRTGQDNITISSYGNYNSTDILFLSLSANTALTKWWNTSINPSFGYVTVNNGSAGIAISGSDKDVFAIQFSVSNTLMLKKGWSAEVSAMYISPFQYGSYRRKTQFNMDLGVSKNIIKNKVSLKLGISDLLNTFNYNKEINYDQVSTKLNYKAESRFINLTLRYKFGNKNVKGKGRPESKISEIQSRIN